MTFEERSASWGRLPNPGWQTAFDARLWFLETRQRLGWSDRDVRASFDAVALKSGLYIGPSGDALLRAPTPSRIRQFLDAGADAPDWIFWMPLAAARVERPDEAALSWDDENIPKNLDLVREAEMARYNPVIDDEEADLLEWYGSLASQDRQAIRSLVEKWKARSRQTEAKQ